MLEGFSVPLTPQGESALARLPPWHYSSDCIAVEYWTDPQAVAALLPPGVVPDEQSNGRAFFWFLDWQFTGSDDELTDPARYQYREAFVLVEAIFEGTSINYCPYIFVDNDAAIARGWAQGFPQEIWQYLPDAQLFCAKRRGCPPCQRKSFRRQCGRAWGKAGNRPYSVGGEGRKPHGGVQPPHDHASALLPTRRGAPAEATGRRTHHVADRQSCDRRRMGRFGRTGGSKGARRRHAFACAAARRPRVQAWDGLLRHRSSHPQKLCELDDLGG
jgi:hypothetical protein